MSVAKVCGNCHKEFSVKPYLAETQKWCGIKCKNEAHRVKKTCAKCSTEFWIFVSQERKGLGQFCSKSCKDASRTFPKKPKVEREVVHKVCLTCECTFRVPPSRKDSAMYCSKECKFSNDKHLEVMSSVQTGDLSPRWKGGKYLRESGYVAQRKAHRGSRPYRYEHQNAMLDWILSESPNHPFLLRLEEGIWFAAGIEIHHIDRNRANNSRDNLIAVTKEAHHRIHDYGKKPEPWECWPSHPTKW